MACVENCADGLADILSSVDIVYPVLKHLPMKDLHRVARVSKIWNWVVKQIKRNRQKSHMLSWCYYYELEEGGVDEQIGQIMENLAIEPQFALIFCSSSLHESTVSIPSKSSHGGSSRFPRATKQEKITFTNFMERILPPSCHLAGVSTDGVVATNFRSNKILELENTVAASCLFLPKLHGVDIYTFLVGPDPETADEEVPEGFFLGSREDEKDPSGSLETNGEASGETSGDLDAEKKFIDAVTGIPEGKVPKLILVFLTDPYYVYDKELGQKMLHRYEGVVIAGGYTDSLIIDKSFQPLLQNKDEPSGFGVAFCGEGIRVASVILAASINSERQVEAELARLKSAHVPERRSIAFMIACIGRGENFYNGQQNVESKAFRKFFPTTPLLGLFGNGEIGFDYLPDYSKPEVVNTASHGADDSESDALYHSYTTIFVMVSFP